MLRNAFNSSRWTAVSEFSIRLDQSISFSMISLVEQHAASAANMSSREAPITLIFMQLANHCYWIADFEGLGYNQSSRSG